MDLAYTVTALGFSVVIVAIATWQERKPYQPGRTWQVPWKALMALALLSLLILCAHLISLLSGHPFTGRSAPSF